MTTWTGILVGWYSDQFGWNTSLPSDVLKGNGDDTGKFVIKFLIKCHCNDITAIQQKFNSRHGFSESGFNSPSMASELLYYDSDSRNILHHRKTTKFLLPSHLTEVVLIPLGWIFNLQLPKYTMKWNRSPLKMNMLKSW